MNRSVAYCTLIVATGVLIVLSVFVPELLSDSNGFLREFVNHEFLNLLGVILAITLASTAQLHLALNNIEEKFDRLGAFQKTRSNVHSAAMWLIGLFLVSVLLVVIKPAMAAVPWQQSLFNGAALLIIIWNVLILIDITRAIFRIEP